MSEPEQVPFAAPATDETRRIREAIERNKARENDRDERRAMASYPHDRRRPA